MTPLELKQRLKEVSGHTLYHEQLKGIEKHFKNKVNYFEPVLSTKEKIKSSLKEGRCVILHSNGKIDKKFNEQEVNFFGLYTWKDTNYTNCYLAYF